MDIDDDFGFPQPTLQNPIFTAQPLVLRGELLPGRTVAAALLASQAVELAGLALPSPGAQKR